MSLSKAPVSQSSRGGQAPRRHKVAQRTCSVNCHDSGGDEDTDDSAVHTGVLTAVDTTSLGALQEMHFDTVGPSLRSPWGARLEDQETSTTDRGHWAQSLVSHGCQIPGVSSSDSHSCPGTADRGLHLTEENAKVQTGCYLQLECGGTEFSRICGPGGTFCLPPELCSLH